MCIRDSPATRTKSEQRWECVAQASPGWGTDRNVRLVSLLITRFGIHIASAPRHLRGDKSGGRFRKFESGQFAFDHNAVLILSCDSVGKGHIPVAYAKDHRDFVAVLVREPSC